MSILFQATKYKILEWFLDNLLGRIVGNLYGVGKKDNELRIGQKFDSIYYEDKSYGINGMKDEIAANIFLQCEIENMGGDYVTIKHRFSDAKVGGIDIPVLVVLNLKDKAVRWYGGKITRLYIRYDNV